jgi:hypothetical protein
MEDFREKLQGNSDIHPQCSTKIHIIRPWGWDSLVGITTVYEMDGRDSIPGTTKIFYLIYNIWGPPSLLSNRQGGQFPWR